MAKPRTPKDKQEKDFQDKIRKRLTGLFSGAEELPTYMSISQVDALKARISELETKLAHPGPAISRQDSVHVQEKSSNPLPAVSDEEMDRRKRTGLWVAGIYAAVSLILLVFSFYMVYVVGTGQPDLSDKTLEPVAGLMIIASLVGFYQIRRDRLAMGAWILLAVAIIPPIFAVLVLNDIFVVMVLFIAILATIPIVWVLPRTDRRQAINATGVSLLAMIGIQIWNPAFRLGSSTLPSFTIYIIVLAALAILGFFIRQALVGNIRTKLLLGFVSVLVLSSLAVVFAVQQQYKSAEQTSVTEASNVAGIISEIVARNQVELQNLVTQLHTSQKRDVKVVGPDLRILADAIPADIGTTFDADQNGEVAATLKDGQQRTFVEISADYPQGIKQVVVPVRDGSGKIIAATTLDYTQSLQQTLYSEAGSFTNEVSATISTAPADLQRFINIRYASQKRDMVVVDRQKQILADAAPDRVGLTYALDLHNELASTLQDGQQRSFVEISVDHPSGLQEVITPIKDPAGKIVGATILGPGPDSAGPAIAQASNVAEAITAAVAQNQVRLQATIDQLHVSQKRDVSVIDPNLQILADAVPAEVGSIFKGDPNGEVAATLKDGQQRTFLETTTEEPQGIKQVVLPVRDGSGRIIAATILDYSLLYTELQQNTNSIVQTLIFLSLAILAVALVISQFISTLIARPISQLRDAALEIGKGRLDTPIPAVTSKDEVGVLAGTFSNMIAQLRGLIGSLEQRVEERTHDLQLASEVGRAVSEKSVDINGLLSKAVKLIGERFNLYYTQIYLIDPSGRTLILRAGTGEVGSQLLARAHKLPIAAGSINGRAAAEKNSVIVADTTQSANFKPNPLLPETRSEMAIPLIAGGEVVGVLDMQSDRPGTLSETNLPAFEALAGQLAIAIQNATLFAETEQARSEVESQVHRLTERGWQGFLDAIERGERMGFGYDQTNVVRLEEETASTAVEEGFSTPISVIGTRIGVIQFAQEPDRIWTAGETELVEGAATQLAQHIENLRLLAQAEKYRAEAEDAVRRLTREGWDTYLQANKDETVGFTYNLNEVSPLTESGNGNHPAAIVQPLTIQDEIVGELSVNTDDGSQEDAHELVSAVSTQLSAHIENLRLSLSNMSLLKSTEERAQREQTLRQITTALRSSTNPATIMRTAVRELGGILGRKTIVQLTQPERTSPAEPVLSSENESDSPAKRS